MQVAIIRLSSLLLWLSGRRPGDIHGSRCVLCDCEWVISRDSFHVSPQLLKIKDWNVQCKLNTKWSWNRIGEFWIRAFVVELRRDLFTSTAVAAAYQHDSSICTTIQMATSVKSREWDCQSYIACCGYLSILCKTGPDLAPTHARLCCIYMYTARSCYCSLCTQTAAWLHCC